MILGLAAAACTPLPRALPGEELAEPERMEQRAELFSVPATASFAAVKGWRGVQPGMTDSEVQDALEARALPFRRTVRRRYPVGFPRRRGHTREPSFRVPQAHGAWTIRCDAGQRVSRISFRTPALESPAAAREVLQSFYADYGPPNGTQTEDRLVWRNATLQLELDLLESSGTWQVIAKLHAL